MARTFVKPNVGSTGIRRIVPIVGIDFIAGQLEKKGGPIAERGTVEYPYGKKSASIGGRTRNWSFVNFLNVRTNFGSTAATADQISHRANFATATNSQRATMQNLTSRTKIQMDFTGHGSGSYAPVQVRAGVDANDYATVRGWVTAVRLAQIAAGETITDTTDTWFS